MMNKKIYQVFTYLFVILSLLPAQAQQNSLQKFKNNKVLKHASIGFCVKDLSGKTVSSYNAETSRTPASTLKLVTTASALELLGADFRYKTTLERSKLEENHLIIRGSGDPTLGTSCMDNDPKAFMDDWIEAIVQNMDTTKVVHITVVDDLFGDEGISERWIWQDMGIQYAAPAYGISIFDNTSRVFLNTLRQDTCPIIIGAEPEMGMIYENRLTTNSKGQDNGYSRGEPLSNKRILTGDIPANRESFALRGDIPNPGLLLGNMIAQRLRDRGLLVDEVYTTLKDYQRQKHGWAYPYTIETDVFYVHQSPTLAEIVREVNVESNNHYTEHLIRTIGLRATLNGSTSVLDNGIEQVKELWKSKGLDVSSLFMYDGCGLAPSNAISASFLCDLLIYMQSKSAESAAFFDSLPVAGKEGTVKSLLRGTRLAGKVHVKSGTIVNVRCYSGYYVNGAKKYVFAIMVNNYNSPRSELMKAIEALLLSTL